MKKIVIFSATLLLSSVGLFVTRNPVLAETNVNISNNANSSTSKVTINNSTSTTNGSTNVENHVRIETNGEVKTFDTTGDQSVDWQSDDGKSSVKINSKTVAPTISQKSSVQAEMKDTTDNASKSSTTPTPSKPVSQKNLISFNFASFFAKIFSFFGFGSSK